MDRKEKIASLLAQGLSPANVAAYSGVTLSYITQLVKDPAFKELILTKMNTEVPQKDEEELLNTKYEGMEHRLLGAMEDALAGAELRDITNALKVVGDRQESRKKRQMPVNTPAAGTQIAVVQINLPRQVIPTLTLNSNNEVVAVDDKPMAPMTSQSVAKLFQTLQQNRQAQEISHESATTVIPIAQALDF